MNNGKFCVLIRTGDALLAVLLNPGNDRSASPASFNSWTTDAQIAAFELKKNGRAMVLNGTYLRGPGETSITRTRMITSESRF
jgi:hypothetical protein